MKKQSETSSLIPPSCALQIKLLKLHCTHAGFIRAGALHGQIIKGIETREKSSAIGRNYRGWVAIASTHAPKRPNVQLIQEVATLAARTYNDPLWIKRLTVPELYTPGHILALARVADVYGMQAGNFPESLLERKVGGWEVGRWAIKLEGAIAPSKPIPYQIPGQGAIYLSSLHHPVVYENLMELIAETNRE